MRFNGSWCQERLLHELDPYQVQLLRSDPLVFSKSCTQKQKAPCWNMVLMLLTIQSIMQTASIQKNNFQLLVTHVFSFCLRNPSKKTWTLGPFDEGFCFTDSLFSALGGFRQTKESTIVMALLAIVCITSQFGQLVFCFSEEPGWEISSV